MTEESVLKAEVSKRAARDSWPAMLLIGAGAVLLVTNLLHIQIIDFFWPAFIVGPSLLMIWPAYKSTSEQQSSLAFMAVPGAMGLMTGALLFLMSLTNHFESMAYAWTLVLAGGAGGYLYMRRFDDPGPTKERAHRFIRAMILAFMGLASFFELLVFNNLGAWWPLALIVVGVYLFVRKNGSNKQ